MSEQQWRVIARSLHTAARPVVRVEMLGEQYVVPNRMRSSKADRDYPILRELAREKRCIFDVGANLGATALVMSAMMKPSGHLVAFEASESACLHIQEVIRLNDLADKIGVVNAAMDERSGLVVDFFWDNASGGASTVAGYLGHTVPVQKATLALDDFVDQFGLRPDLLKIDVEGAESRVLRGASNLLATYRPTAFVELHSWEGVSVVENASAILPDLKSLGYEMVYLKTKAIIDDPAMLEGRGRCHVLLLAGDSPDWQLLDSLDTTGL